MSLDPQVFLTVVPLPRERIPHIGPLTEVIRLKLFLDIVPSSSEDITRAMRGQPKRLFRNYMRKNGGNVILYVLVSFHTGDVCAVGHLVCFSARLAVHYFAVYSVLGSSIKQT